MNNIWQIKVTKPGAIETVYLCIKQEDTQLDKKQINRLLQLFRDKGFLISLHGYGWEHYLKFESTTHRFARLDALLNTIAIMKFHKEVTEQVSVHRDVLIDSFYVTRDEMFQLDVLTRYNYVKYNGLDYTFLNTEFPRRLGYGLWLNTTKFGNFFYRGTIYHSIDYEKGIVKFFRRTTSYETTTKTIEI